MLQCDLKETLIYIGSILYASSQSTNGYISETSLRVLHPRIRPSQKMVDHLIEVGLWSRAEGGYQIANFLKWQRSAGQYQSQKDSNTQRQNKKRHGVTEKSVTPTEKRREEREERDNPLEGYLSLSPSEEKITPLPNHETVGDRLCESGHKLLRGQPAKFCATCRRKPPIVLVPERDPDAEENARLAQELGEKIMRGEELD